MITTCNVCSDYRVDSAAFQNQRYGVGVRVHNPQGGKNKGKARCSVCGTEKQVSSASAPRKK